MKSKKTKELLNELEVHIVNHTMAKVNFQHEGRFERIRTINLLKAEILSRLNKEVEL